MTTLADEIAEYRHEPPTVQVPVETLDRWVNAARASERDQDEIHDLRRELSQANQAIKADTQVINDLNARVRELEAKVAPVHVDARAVVEDVAVSLRNEASRIRMGIIKPIEAGWVPTWMETLADRLRSVL